MASWFGGGAAQPEPEPEPELASASDRDPKSERCSAALAALREALATIDQAQLRAALPGVDDFTLLRFLIAREFDVPAAVAMVAERVEWRVGAGAADPTSTCINSVKPPLNPWSRGETLVQGYKVGIVVS